MKPRILTLFMSAGKSLRWWQQEGILAREMAVYREFLLNDAFGRIQLFTYDGRDHTLLSTLKTEDPLYGRIDLLSPPSGKGGALWAAAGVVRHYWALRRSTVLKTNQISGSWAAIAAALVTRRPLVLRLGYVLSRRFALNGQRIRALVARAIERLGMAIAARVIVTSEAARDALKNEVRDNKLILLPSYVDLDVFAAREAGDENKGVIAVGRMRPQKNQAALIEACAAAGASLTLVGKGELEADLRALAVQSSADVNFAGTVDNQALAKLFRQHAIFILPSLHEGLPKVLLEAMSCGLICVGTPIPGITDLIRDGETGFLATGHSAQDIAAAIRRAQTEGTAAIGRNARELIAQRFGLHQYAQREAEIFRQLG